MPYLQTERATLWHARAEEVYPHLDPGSVSMAWVDGPYAMRKAPWDMMKVDDLPAFYAPHYEALSRVLAPSATVYHWGTAEGWARVDPVIRGMGWTFRDLIIWDKMNTAASMQWLKGDHWPETHEVCAMYQRGAPFFRATYPRSVWSLAIQSWADEILGTGEFKKGARNQDGAPCSVKVRLHPCQKPLLFASRAILASTRPGDTIIDPFAGTNRCAIACHRLPAEEARHAYGIEMDARWLDAIRPALVADYGHVPKGQAALFGVAGASP